MNAVKLATTEKRIPVNRALPMKSARITISSKYDLTSAERISALPERELADYSEEIIFWCNDCNWPTASVLVPLSIRHPKIVLSAIANLIADSTNGSAIDYDGVRVVLGTIVWLWSATDIAPLNNALESILLARNIPKYDEEVLGIVAELILKFNLDVSEEARASALSIFVAHPEWRNRGRRESS